MSINNKSLLEDLKLYISGLNSIPFCFSLSAQKMVFGVYSDTPEKMHFVKEYLFPYFITNDENFENTKDSIKLYVKNISQCPIQTCIFLLIENNPSNSASNLFSFDDDQYVRLPLIEERWHIIYSPIRKDACIIADQQYRRVYILDMQQNLAIVQFALIRIIRNLTQYRLEHSTHCSLHAAAVSIKKQAVLIAGDQYAGKTTLLCALLTDTEAHFISNDRVSIHCDTYEVVGWPFSPGVRAGTVRINSYLQHYFEQTQYDSYPFNSPITQFYEKAMSQKLSPEETFRFLPRTFCHIFQKEIIPYSRLRAIIHPLYDPEISKPVVSHLSYEDACLLLKRNIHKHAFYDPWWKPLSVKEQENDFYHELAQVFPVIQIRQNERTLQEVGKIISSLLTSQRE